MLRKTTRQSPRTSDGMSDLAITLLAAIAMLAYPIAFAALYGLLGAQTFPFAIVPVGIVAWRFGARAGIAAVLAQLATTTVLLNIFGVNGWGGLLAEGQGPVSLLLFATAVSIGFLRDQGADLTDRATEAEALADATRRLVAGSAAHDTLRGILTAAMRVVPSTVAAFIVPVDGGSAIRVAALTNGHQEFLGRTYPASKGVTGRAMRSGQVQRVHDAARDPDYVPWTEEVQSVLAIPVVRVAVTT